jgi:O-antigen/teichoic acid export membrane protein
MVPGLFFLGVRKINEYLLWANSRFRETAVLGVSEAILKSAIGIPCVIVLGVKGLILGLVTAELFCSGLSIFFLRDILFYPCFKFYSAKELFKNSWPYYLEGYFNYFLSQGDNWIITTCLGPQTLGVYYVAKRFYMFFFTSGKSFEKIITTKLAMNKSDKNKISSSIKHIILRTSQLVTPASLFFIGLIPSLIYVAFGPKYMGAVVPCIILCLGVVVRMYFYPIRRGIFILWPSMTRFKIAVLETIIVIVSLLIFTPAWKVNGIALSWLIGIITASLTTYFILKKGLDFKLPLKDSLLSLFISSMMAYVLIICQIINFSLVLLPLYACAAVFTFIILSKMTGAGIHSDMIKFIRNPKEI